MLLKLLATMLYWTFDNDDFWKFLTFKIFEEIHLKVVIDFLPHVLYVHLI